VQAPDPRHAPPIPAYLRETYPWAYLTPRAVRVFERQWLVNLILWGQFARLRDAALDALASALGGQVLQVACVYGNLTPRLVQRLAPGGHLSVVDVAPIQLANLARKLPPGSPASLHGQDSVALSWPDASQDAVLLFFLLHEQPEDVRRRTLAEAWRVLRPGGRLVVVDYHRPAAWHPARWVMGAVLRWLEPFAWDLWRHPVTHWLPADARPSAVAHDTWFGGLYQRVVFTR
jgi:ubiquinone/menaquinone biosynthesis C-methylase UbiE